MLQNIGQSTSTVIWASWCDEHDVAEFWPKVVGTFVHDETAIVFEVSDVDTIPIGAKICTEKKVVGWVSVKYLKRV